MHIDNNKNPFVSIIIPTFNHGTYLKRALESVIEQTYTKWEAIIIDNNSTDNTNEVIKNFNDPRIKSYKINNNGVIAASRNKGIQKAKGVWLAFLDSDDWWAKEKLTECLKYADKKVDLIYHETEIISKKINHLNKKRIIKSRQLKSPVLIDLLLKGNPIVNSSVIVRKELINKIGGISEKKELIAAEDYNTWLRIAKISNQFLYVPYRLGYYFEHENNISHKNMTIPVKFAVEEFREILSSKEKLKLEANMEYLSLKYGYFSNDYNIKFRKLCLIMFHSEFKVSIKALLIFMYLKIIKRHDKKN